MKKHELNTRQQKIDYVFYLDAECYAIEKEIGRSNVHLILAKNASDRLVAEIKMDDFINFCQTGKYPND
jgi:hypothetical protein